MKQDLSGVVEALGVLMLIGLAGSVILPGDTGSSKRSRVYGDLFAIQNGVLTYLQDQSQMPVTNEVCQGETMCKLVRRLLACGDRYATVYLEPLRGPLPRRCLPGSVGTPYRAVLDHDYDGFVRIDGEEIAMVAGRVQRGHGPGVRHQG